MTNKKDIDFQTLIRCRFNTQPYAVHLTHIKNLFRIFQESGLLCKNELRSGQYTDLSNLSVQGLRANKAVPGTDLTLHDFVPLYFGIFTPMIAALHKHNQEIIHLRFGLQFLNNNKVRISDGNAASTATKIWEYYSLDDLAAIDWKAVNTRKYGGDAEKKRKKSAEVLVPKFLSLDYLHDIICFSADARDQVLKIVKDSGIKLALNVSVNSSWYVDR